MPGQRTEGKWGLAESVLSGGGSERSWAKASRPPQSLEGLSLPRPVPVLGFREEQ